MARSSGARPKKAVRKEVAALRAVLAECRNDQWQKAQCIFDQICALCEVTGPSNGMMVPRSCRVCGYYGHTKQFCPVWKARLERMTEREIEMDKAHGYVPPQCEEECPLGPDQWKWICRHRAITARQEEGTARGLGCKKKRTITWASDRRIFAFVLKPMKNALSRLPHRTSLAPQPPLLATLSTPRSVA